MIEGTNMSGQNDENSHVLDPESVHDDLGAPKQTDSGKLAVVAAAHDMNALRELLGIVLESMHLKIEALLPPGASKADIEQLQVRLASAVLSKVGPTTVVDRGEKYFGLLAAEVQLAVAENQRVGSTRSAAAQVLSATGAPSAVSGISATDRVA